jgi:hypothetical protein
MRVADPYYKKYIIFSSFLRPRAVTWDLQAKYVIYYFALCQGTSTDTNKGLYTTQLATIVCICTPLYIMVRSPVSTRVIMCSQNSITFFHLYNIRE